jgi:hypothetical protein
MKITKQRIVQIIREELSVISEQESIDNTDLAGAMLTLSKDLKANTQVSSESPMINDLVTLLIDKASSSDVDAKLEDILNYAKSKLGEQE